MEYWQDKIVPNKLHNVFKKVIPDIKDGLLGVVEVALSRWRLYGASDIEAVVTEDNKGNNNDQYPFYKSLISFVIFHIQDYNMPK